MWNDVKKLTQDVRLTIQSIVMTIADADYCLPVWMIVFNTKLDDTKYINFVLRLIWEAIQPTDVEWLNVLCKCEESAWKELKRIYSNNELPIYNDLMSAPLNLTFQKRQTYRDFFS